MGPPGPPHVATHQRPAQLSSSSLATGPLQLLGAAAACPSVLSCPTTEPGSTTAVEYISHLAHATHLAGHACAPSTLLKRDKVMLELTQWLHSLPAREGAAVNVYTAHATDVVAFIVHWVQTHAGGQPSPNYVQQLVSHMRVSFDCLGRHHKWGKANHLVCNPTKFPFIDQIVRGYGRIRAADGYEPKAAVPVSPSDVEHCLVQMLHRFHGLSDSFQQLLLARDGICISLAAVLGRRGGNLCQLRWTDFSYDIGRQHPWGPAANLPVPSSLYLRMLDKTHQLIPCPTIHIGAPALGPGHDVSPLFWLLAYKTALQRNVLTAPSAYLIRSSAPNHCCLVPSPMTATALNQRFQVHMGAAGLPDDVTMHGIRRGLAQEFVHAGVEQAAAMSLLGMASVATFARYADPGAPVKRHRAN
jgi:integrase